MNTGGYQETFQSSPHLRPLMETCMLCDNPFPFGCSACTADMVSAMNASSDDMDMSMNVVKTTGRTIGTAASMPAGRPGDIPGDGGYPPGDPYDRPAQPNEPKPKMFVGSGEDCVYVWLRDVGTAG